MVKRRAFGEAQRLLTYSAALPLAHGLTCSGGSIAGFTSWGDEAPEGEPPPDHYQRVLLEA